MPARIPYSRQSIDEDDIQAVLATLKSDWLTTGPVVPAFEQALAAYTGARYAVAFNSGTAALHAAYFAAGVGPGDEVITTPISFVATANAALFLGANVVFADIDPETVNIDPGEIVRSLSQRTKVIAPVDFAGHPADLDEIMAIAQDAGAVVVEDACHALGARYKGRPVGSIAHMTVFSFHPVKAITTGEGGAVCTNDPGFYEKLLLFRNHGIVRDRSRMTRDEGPWYYEMQALGPNYRLSDIHASLGLSQLAKLDRHIAQRRAIAHRYDTLLRGRDLVLPPRKPWVDHAWHLYTVQLPNARFRRWVVEALHEAGIGVQVHYLPIYRHPYYRSHGYADCFLPHAERYYSRCLSLPLYPGLSADDVDRVVAVLLAAVEATRPAGRNRPAAAAQIRS